MPSLRKNNASKHRLSFYSCLILWPGRLKTLILILGLIPLAGCFFSGCTYDGSALFHRQGCIQCHRFQGQGGMMAPDLTAVGQRHDRAWMDRYIQNPAAVDPRARMPAFPNLSEGERQAIIDFLVK
jgi:cytochrome c551/c552